MRESTRRKYVELLYHYNQILESLGDEAGHVSKSRLYYKAGKEVYLCGETAGRIINSIIRIPSFVKAAKCFKKEDD
jgi:hypothetical protein